MAMDAKDLRTDSAISATIRDGNANYDQSSATLQSNRNKLYQDIGSNSLGKVEAQGARPCAIIGPDRVLPPPTPTPSDAYLKKASVDPWPCTGNVYTPQSDFPQKLPDYQSVRNISPRQTFQENMQRIMVPPSYHTTKNVEDNTKSSKVDMPLEVKYCDVPYSINPTVNNQKSIRTDVPITGVLPFARGVQHHVWSGGVSSRPQRPYAPEFYQFPEFANHSGPRAIQRFHRPSHDDPAQVQHDRLYHEANVRFKPYPNAKERYPQHRYDYMNNYTNTYHPQAPFPPQKYDISKNIPTHSYPVYPQIPMRRMPEPIIDPYQRSNQPNFNPYQNQYIPSYGPVAANCIPSKMYSYPREMSAKTLTATKLPYDINNKFYVDYENVRNKMYHSVDNMTYYNDRQGSSKGDIALSMHPGINVHHIPQHHMYRKENMQKTFETLHYRGIDPSLYVNNTFPRHPLQFSPMIAKSPADSNTSNEAIQSIGILQEDGGYVSQSSTASGRSIDSGNYRTQNETYRKHNNSSSNIYGSTVKNMPKHFSRSHSENGAEKKGLDVRQFLQMWNEGEDEVSESNNTSINSNIFSTQSETISNPEQLVVLGLVNIPNEELSKYEHIQKISKLPENIKGYNSIELLDQYEQLVETPALRHHKKIVQHEYQFSPKSLAKQSSQLPRPISPLDVEAKISQSVIHKEVGCNFEIKPCSPKMLNIEVATPVQNIMDERTIEKVLNRGITNSPLLPNRSEHVSFNSPSTSCKMNSPYISNNDLMTRNNYSLKDLESNSGVCLASLPRLDSDIELNFPEINQQFIDANRYNTNPCHENSDILSVNLYKPEHEFIKDLSELNKSPELNTYVETAKLSKYRKNKSPESLHDNNLNHTAHSRTDSVIIKNPENMRKKDEIMPSITTIEKTENVQEKDLSNTGNMSIGTDVLEDFNSSAIDFSLNKMSQNISNTITENVILNPNVENFKVNNCKVNDCIPNDDVQLDALSLVTKKVEMELREFERNENNSKSNQKINDSEASLCLNYEDINTIPDSVRKNDKNCFEPLQTDTKFQSMDITNEDKNNSDVINSGGSHTLLNIDDISPYNSKITIIQEETHFKSESLQKVEEIFKDEIVIATLQSTNSKETIIENVSDDIMEEDSGIICPLYQNNVDIDEHNEKLYKNNEQCKTAEKSDSEPRKQKDTETKALYLESNVSVLNQNNVKECEKSSQVLCANKHVGVEDFIEDVTVLNGNEEHIGQCKNIPTQLITKDACNEDSAQNETGNTDLINNNSVCIGIGNGNKIDIGTSEKNENAESVKDKRVKDELIIKQITVNLGEKSDRECKNDGNEHGDNKLNMHEETGIVLCEDVVNVESVKEKRVKDELIIKQITVNLEENSDRECKNDGNEHGDNKLSMLEETGIIGCEVIQLLEAKSIIQNEDKNTQIKIRQNLDANSCEINEKPFDEIITKDQHAEIDMHFSLPQQPENVMSLDQSFPEVSFDNCANATTECTINDHSEKANLKVDPNKITRHQNLLKEKNYSCVENVPKQPLECHTSISQLKQETFSISTKIELENTPEVSSNNSVIIAKQNIDDQEDINLNFGIAHSKNLTDVQFVCQENVNNNCTVHLKNMFLQTESAYFQTKVGESSLEDSFNNVTDKTDETTDDIDPVYKGRSEVKNYLKKELFSPWIQKLFMFREGSCTAEEYITDIKVDVAQMKEKLETINNTNENVQDSLTSINSDYKSIFEKCSNNRQMNIEEGINIITDSCKKDDNEETREGTNIPEVNEKLETKKDTNENVQDTLTTFNSNSESIVGKCSSSNQMLIEGCINVRTDLCLKDDNEETREGVYVSKSLGEENGMNLTIIMNNETSENTKTNCLFNQCVNLKRSLSDSALDLYSEDSFIGRASSNKRRKFINENLLGCNVIEENFCEHIQNNRRKSVSAICNNENVFILIDDNAYVIAQEDDDSSKLCDTSDLFNASNNILDDCVSHEPEESLVEGSTSNVDYEQSIEDKTVQEAWVDGVDCIENIFNDDVAVDITISAPISPENSSLSSSDNYNDDICSDNESEHIVRIKEIYGDNMCINDVQIVETLYKMPQMDVNKTLVDIEPHNSQEYQIEVNASSNSYKKQESPIRFDSLVKPQSLCCNNDLKICDKENQDAPLDFNSLNFSNNIQISAEDTTFLNNQSSKDIDIDPCDLRNECTSLVSSSYRYAMSSSPEVSSTTPEEKSSGISLNITSRNGSSPSEIKKKSQNAKEVCYKFNENNDYTTNYRPLITKAAQKYIPPLIEAEDLKVKLPLPQQSLNKLKELKLAKKEFLSDKSNIKTTPHQQGVTKKVKPKFEDVLKSIDEIQYKKHREKTKRAKHSIPKVVIKKNENGAHYATPIKKSSYNPDLTGRKWQPWVFIERNDLVDRMAQRNKRKAIYCHRKKTFILQEKFKKYKSICTAKFVITQPTTDNASSGNLKYTIRLKHNY